MTAVLSPRCELEQQNLACQIPQSVKQQTRTTSMNAGKPSNQAGKSSTGRHLINNEEGFTSGHVNAGNNWDSDIPADLD